MCDDGKVGSAAALKTVAVELPFVPCLIAISKGAVMASIAVNSPDKGAYATLVASAVDTITFNRDLSEVEVLNRNGAAEIFFTVDGTTPTVGGANCYVLPAAISSAVVKAPGHGPTVVKLISSGTPIYGVSST